MHVPQFFYHAVALPKDKSVGSLLFRVLTQLKEGARDFHYTMASLSVQTPEVSFAHKFYY